jgi:dihydrodipicolinate synthase/N-acetylneuraminate lyase
VDAGAGGLAVGVHTTQFAIHDPKVGLYRPVLELAAETILGYQSFCDDASVKVAGLVGDTAQACREAALAVALGYDCGLLSLAALRDADDAALLAHCRAVAEIIPLFGFYLQPAVGGRVLTYAFWRRFAEIERVVAIKVAPFNRYQTLDVVRAVADSGRGGEIALYTGNDDHIVEDLLAEYRFGAGHAALRIVGGLLGHWAVWTRRAAEILAACHAMPGGQAQGLPLRVLASQITDCNAALFDAAHNFAGCIAGIHEVLRRQGLLAGRWLLDPREDLSPGQVAEIDRVCAAYPHLQDDEFVRENLDRWMA